ncbi:MAG TPA: P27 family phage terminase small subunit [Clostridia bacterium]|nr:P27 family phage terminase small subunit [Clostridia bacterium]
MAKDGTLRGGRRVRAGDKPQPLTEKITKGKTAKILEVPDFQPESILEAEDLEVDADFDGEEMPSPSDYLSSKQKDGKTLGADDLFIETWKWLRNRGCEKFVNPRLIEAYAQAFTRYIQCEEAISTYGLLGKHPTTGGAMASPFVQMSQSFQKQANLLWYEIFDIVKQNCTTAFVGNPQDDIMEALLSGRKGR